MSHPSKGQNRTIEISIDELILDGFAPGDRYAIAAALERGLTEMFLRQEFNPGETGAAEIGRLDAGSVHLGQQVTPRAIGEEVAGAVYLSLQAGEGHD